MKYLSFEYWRARLFGSTQPKSDERIGIMTMICPCCYKPQDVYFEYNCGLNSYVCKDCKNVYCIEVKAIVWREKRRNDEI